MSYIEPLKKTFVYVALALVGYSLWQAWEKDRVHQQVEHEKAAIHQQHVASLLTHQQATKERTITVETDRLTLSIDRKGGQIIHVALHDYAEKQGEKSRVSLMSQDPKSYEVGQFGFSGLDHVLYDSAQSHWVMGEHDAKLNVVLTGHNEHGISVTKTLHFKRGQYLVDVSTTVKNQGKKPWSTQSFIQFVQKAHEKKSGLGANRRSYTGLAFHSDDKPYQKLDYKEISKHAVHETTNRGWVALQRPYFLSAWVSKESAEQQVFADQKESGHYVIGVIGQKGLLAPHTSATSQASLYVGPEIEADLKGVAPGLELTIDYGWLWLLSEALYWLLVHAYGLLGNWGWSIVVVTCLIKLAFLPLNNKTYQSMRRMQSLAPKIDALKAQHGGDRQALAQATMMLYKKEKVNPMGGCLPMLVQIPFFFALYWVLIESVQLRHAPFMLWVHDLSSKDPYYILPVLMGLSMWAQQQLTPKAGSPEQAQIMMFMPVIFTFVFASFPAGLVLYWLTNNLLTILQQWWVLHHAKDS